MVNTKEVNQAIIKEQIWKIGEATKKATAAKDTYRKRLAGLKLQKDSYTEEYLKELQAKARADLASQLAEMHSGLKNEHEKLGKTLIESHNSFDPSELKDSVSLIKSVGPDLAYETVAKINARFAHNQSALKVLQSAYKSAGIVSNGGLDKQLYSIEEKMQKIQQASEETFLRNGSINAYASEVGKLAELEGHEFEKLPDAAGAKELMWKAAGLAPE